MSGSWEWQPEYGDRMLTLLALAIVFGTWRSDREIKQRLADLEVPNGIQLPALMFALVGKRMRDRQWAEAGKSMDELAEVLATRMVESDKRQQQLLDLQANLERLAQESSRRETRLVALQESVETYTKWLLALTVVVAVVGVATIAATVVIAATQ